LECVHVLLYPGHSSYLVVRISGNIK